ncbi:hypothetical protein SIO70_15800 [Chitinophaga sancti]|uniref:hypothetical protein n=1 Tax=Chitinophaga sancti TaxID=1004 RepID=UPI002A74E0C2|nr:hypothetical protein [Chitinophaga sancti]WPQ66322.1 hypothetical protein SIO70_15800 [Chitinophaga sancti]
MSENREPLFFIESSLDKLKTFLNYTIILWATIYVGKDFSANPVLITIVLLVFLIAFYNNSYSQIRVNRDSSEHTFKHPVDLFSHRTSILFSDIESIEMDLKRDGANFILIEMIGSLFVRYTVTNTIRFKLKDGTEKILMTQIFKKDVLKAIEILRRVTGNKIQIFEWHL